MRAECHEQEEGKALWCQAYRLPPSLALFDARPLALDSFAAGVFTVIEQELGRARDALGGRVGELIAERFDGFIVPSVKGSMRAEYVNVVVFKPDDPPNRWHAFVDSNEAPRELA